MPTYDYRCKKCKKRFERLQSIISPPLKKCVHCGGPVERLIGAGAGLIFKGSGFYTTDYKKKSGMPSASEKAPKAESKPKKSGGQ